MRRITLFATTLVALSISGAAATPKKNVRGRTHPVSRPIGASDVEDTTKTGAVRVGSVGPLVMRAQILLDRARFSPGEIDGHYGEDLAIAIKGFQQAHDLAPTGTVDPALWEILNADIEPLLVPYTITADDEKGPFQPVPKGADEQSKLTFLGFESPEEGLGEKFHISPKLLAAINPGKNLANAGEQIVVPNISRPPSARALRIVVSKSRRTVSAFGLQRKLLAQYPATIGGEHDPLEAGRWFVKVIQPNPTFYYDPKHYWNADPTEAKTKLPPGPNNPVGVVWIGLSKPHIGIHGTPDPAHIHHSESYGCVRLTNWDAEDLSKMVRRGTPTLFEE